MWICTASSQFTDAILNLLLVCIWSLCRKTYTRRGQIYLKAVEVHHVAWQINLPTILLYLPLVSNLFRLHKDTCRRNSVPQKILRLASSLGTRCCHHLLQFIADTLLLTRVIFTHTTMAKCRWEWRRLTAVKFFQTKYVRFNFIFLVYQKLCIQTRKYWYLVCK